VEGWLLRGDTEPGREFRLKYVSLEAHTVCNQSCYFCPVSIAPREDYFMPTELYERIVGELAAYRDTIEAVFMINYNEPTVDRRFVEQVGAIRAAGLPPAVLTNGSGLTPGRVDALVALGGLRFLSINLSTLDRERYRRERGGDHLGLVLRNLDYAKDQPLAEQMDMVVLGTGNEDHQRDFEEISRYFAGSRFEVKYFEVMDRAGYLQIGHKPAIPNQRLCGCENVGSRPLQHLHITPRGTCVLCCEDYDAKYVVGDLTQDSVEGVLTGPGLARMRRWAYGLDEAPRDFLCRGCTFALTRPS
jgi:MoaA/NifB/PqqE/SkfB family radical SAM enzyme